MDSVRNVFILSVDSLNQRSFSDSAAEISDLTGGTMFTNAIATASDTNSAMPGLAAGVYSDTIPGWGLPDEGAPLTLAEAFAESGYETGLWTDNFLFGEEYNYTAGFQGGNLGAPTIKKRVAEYIKNSHFAPLFGIAEWTYFNLFRRIESLFTTEEGFYRSAPTLNDGMLEWLEAIGTGSAFCWIHYMDAHHPYEPPERYLTDRTFNTEVTPSTVGSLSRDVIKSNGEDFSADQISDVATAYEACCEYVGDEIISLIQQLKSEGHFDPDRDFLVITADHGECLDPESFGMMGHVPPAFWEDIVRVPLVIAHPEWDHRTIDSQVSLIDLMPTVLDAAGLEPPSTIDGEPRNNPSDFERAYSFFVSEWTPPDRDDSHFFRGVRSATGTKLFGSYVWGDATTVYTEYEGEEESVMGVGEEEIASEADQRDVETLRAELDYLGTPLEKVIDSASRDVDYDHLRDLGYVE